MVRQPAAGGLYIIYIGTINRGPYTGGYTRGHTEGTIHRGPYAGPAHLPQGVLDRAHAADVRPAHRRHLHHHLAEGARGHPRQCAGEVRFRRSHRPHRPHRPHRRRPSGSGSGSGSGVGGACLESRQQGSVQCEEMRLLDHLQQPNRGRIGGQTRGTFE